MCAPDCDDSDGSELFLGNLVEEDFCVLRRVPARRL
jgi:hypothetical protein